MNARHHPDPAFVAARLNEAQRCAGRGDIDDALRIVEPLAAQDPHDWRIHERLGEIKVSLGRFPEAAMHFQAAAERKPNDPSLIFKWARATFDAGDSTAAAAILDGAARLAPGHEAILRLYGEIHERSGDWGNLARIAQTWLRSDPRNPSPWRFAATAQWETGYLKQAMQSYRGYLDRAGASAVDLATFGRLCLTAHAYDDAARALDEAERLDPRCGHMLSAQATLAMFRGRFETALAYARRAIAVDAADMVAFKVLLQVTGGDIARDEHEQIQRLAQNDALPLRTRISASFALGDYLDAHGDFDAAFTAYARANALSAELAESAGLRYGRAERERQIDALVSTFASVPPAAPTPGVPTPIFIVGMPRSGTTLVETIVGAHSRIFACGERQEMRSIMQELGTLPPQSGMAGVTEGTRKRWRESFLRELPDLQGAAAVTDKNPWNFDALGVIFALFPQARVIHVRRNPVETGLSIFRNEFPKFVAFAQRLEDIGHYYGQYARLMAHWETALGGRFLTLQYEDLTRDLDRFAPELVCFCGLPWEEACRDFGAGERVIGTMSAVQARRPVTAFKDRRERYARHLAPLVSALNEAGVDLMSGAKRSS